MYDFTNKVVVITGATGDLAPTVVAAFENAGARLVLVERSKGHLAEMYPELAASDKHYMAEEVDLTKPETVKSMAVRAAEQLGRIDVLVNIAGGFSMKSFSAEDALDTFDYMFNLNARTNFIAVHSVLPHMLEGGGGKIISVAAGSALSGRSRQAGYSASKAAVLRITESVAAEFKDKGIYANAILPSAIDTPSNRESMPNADPSKWLSPAEIADVILFLASDLSRAINGVGIPL
jgi:NAD(P)-dependent dehydrogenase (short-subunit alcohol dehydrogenase family)